MDGFEERLAEEVRKYPHIYDSSRRDYKDLQKTSNSWKEIAEKLETNDAVCRQKWKKIRDRFTKAKKRLKSKSGDPGGKIIPAIVISLSWLSTFIKHRETDSNFRLSEVTQNLTENGRTEDYSIEAQLSGTETEEDPTSLRTISLEDLQSISPEASTSNSRPSTPLSMASTPYSRTSLCDGTAPPSQAIVPAILETSPGQSVSSDRCQMPPSSSKRSKKRAASPTTSALLERLDSIKSLREERKAHSSNEEMRFAETVADTLKKLPPQLKSEAKFAINKILFEMEQKLYSSDFN